MSSQGELHSAPEGGGAALFQEVAAGHLEAVVLAVVGDGAHTDGLTQLHELLGDLSDGMGGFYPICRHLLRQIGWSPCVMFTSSRLLRKAYNFQIKMSISYRKYRKTKK